MTAASGPEEGAKSATGRARSKKISSQPLTLRLAKSGICTPKDQKATLRGLGFSRVGQRIVREDTPSVRGMVHKVRHLVTIEKE